MTTVVGPRNAANITPSDTAALGFVTSYVAFINTAGTQTLTIDTPNGQSKILLTLPTGMYNIAASKIWATGTTVTGIVGFWFD